MYINDDAWKLLVSCWLQIAVMDTPAEWEHKNQIEGTSVVPAKNPLKIKLVNEKPLRTL